MTPRQTYYDLFGVSRTASARQIRAAYIRLMKNHHPDAMSGSEQAFGPDLAPILNRCYAVLSDPVKRAAYDAQIASAGGQAKLPAQVRHIRASTGSKLHPNFAAMAVPALLAAGVALTILLREISAEGEPAYTPASWFSPSPKASADETPIPLPSKLEIALEARRATSVSPTEAVGTSKRCFKEARQQSSAELAQRCVVFDQAFVYWRDAMGALPIYYQDQVMAVRHSSALSTFGSAAQDRLNQLEHSAFRGLLDQVRGTSSEAEGTVENKASGLPPQSGASPEPSSKW